MTNEKPLAPEIEAKLRELEDPEFWRKGTVFEKKPQVYGWNFLGYVCAACVPLSIFLFCAFMFCYVWTDIWTTARPQSQRTPQGVPSQIESPKKEPVQVPEAREGNSNA